MSSQVAKEISKLKAYAVYKDHPNDTVLGCDTVVVIDNMILGKPIDKEDARRMLHLLSDRKHIVLSNSNDFPSEVVVYNDFNELLESLKDSQEEIFVIGGSSIYKLFLDYSNKLYLTEIDASSECDTYFPEFDKTLYEREVLAENEEEGITYKHVLYKKK